MEAGKSETGVLPVRETSNKMQLSMLLRKRRIGYFAA
jgi:hypothetical protein